MKTVMIIAGESSGDLHGSLLARALKGLWPDIRLVGIGGERMRDAGVEILSGIAGAFGVTEVAASVRKLRDSFKKAKNALIEYSPDVTVLIDYPDFNFRVGRAAKKLGLKVLYYVSPHVWVWRKGRVRTMGEIADKVAVILPFEEEIYRKAGIPCEFVGHPAMEEIEAFENSLKRPDAANQDNKSKIQNSKSRIAKPVIALLPGSRPSELSALLPVFAELAGVLRKTFPGCKLLLPLAPNIETDKFRQNMDALRGKGVEFSRNAIKTLAASDMAVIASGTATLQAALLGIPMVVVYKVSAVTYLIGRTVLDLKFISLANILPGRKVVAELIQRKANPEDIALELKRIWSDTHYREDMTSSLLNIRAVFYGRRPSKRVAEMVGELAGWTA